MVEIVGPSGATQSTAGQTSHLPHLNICPRDQELLVDNQTRLSVRVDHPIMFKCFLPVFPPTRSGPQRDHPHVILLSCRYLVIAGFVEEID